MKEREFLIDEIELGHRFSPLIYPITEELIRKYLDAVGSDDSLHPHLSCGGEMIAPPGLAGFVLKAYRTDSAPPPGGVLFRQRFKFHRPMRAGDLLHLEARVADKYLKKGKKFLVFEILARNEDGENVIWAEVTAFWRG